MVETCQLKNNYKSDTAATVNSIYIAWSGLQTECNAQWNVENQFLKLYKCIQVILPDLSKY